jgi:hypothetical protein
MRGGKTTPYRINVQHHFFRGFLPSGLFHLKHQTLRQFALFAANPTMKITLLSHNALSDNFNQIQKESSKKNNKINLGGIL